MSRLLKSPRVISFNKLTHSEQQVFLNAILVADGIRPAAYFSRDEVEFLINPDSDFHVLWKDVLDRIHFFSFRYQSGIDVTFLLQKGVDLDQDTQRLLKDSKVSPQEKDAIIGRQLDYLCPRQLESLDPPDFP